MKNPPAFFIEPHAPRYSDPPQTRPAASETELNGCLGFVIWITVVIIGYIILGNTKTPQFPTDGSRNFVKLLYYTSPCIAGAFVVGGIIDQIQKRNRRVDARRELEAAQAHERARDQARREAEHAARKEAQQLSDRLQAVLQNAAKQKQVYWDLLDASRLELVEARNELQRSASVYFWDHYENAVARFYNAMNVSAELNRMLQEYYHALTGRTHNFPEFPLRADELSWGRDVQAEILEAHRLAIERGGDFIHVWEARRTRDAIHHQTKTLEGAVFSLGEVMSSSLAKFEKSVSENVARDVIAEIRRSKQGHASS